MDVNRAQLALSQGEIRALHARFTHVTAEREAGYLTHNEQLVLLLAIVHATGTVMDRAVALAAKQSTAAPPTSNGTGGTVSFIRTRLYGPEASENQRWANAHIDEMAARYPGKIVGISNSEVVIVAGTMESYKEKRSAWYGKKHDEGSRHHAVTPVPRRKIVAP